MKNKKQSSTRTGPGVISVPPRLPSFCNSLGKWNSPANTAVFSFEKFVQEFMWVIAMRTHIIGNRKPSVCLARSGPTSTLLVTLIQWNKTHTRCCNNLVPGESTEPLIGVTVDPFSLPTPPFIKHLLGFKPTHITHRK